MLFVSLFGEATEYVSDNHGAHYFSLGNTLEGRLM